MEQSGNLTSLVAVVGNHLEGKTNADIGQIRLINFSQFTRIPSNIGNLLPNLIAIDFRAELLTSVSADDLKQFPNITYLSIYGSQIVSLDADLFKYTPHIQALVIPSNKLVSVARDLLTSLVDLKWVNFLSNPCLSYYASRPHQLEWLKSNLPLRCPDTQATPKPTIPTPPTPPQVTATQTTHEPSVPTSSIVTTTQTTRQTTPTPTAPVDDCKIRCSLNEEMDELKYHLIEHGKLIADLFEIVSDYSQRMFELEKFNAKIANAVKMFLSIK